MLSHVPNKKNQRSPGVRVATALMLDAQMLNQTNACMLVCVLECSRAALTCLKQWHEYEAVMPKQWVKNGMGTKPYYLKNG